jgi:hypothetical protein
MPTSGPLKPNHKAVIAYYDALKTYAGQHVEHEGALETAFSRLLADTARPHGWTLIPKMPPAVFDYRLGNRSALDWIIDQYRVTEDPRSGIRSDPNRADDPEYIVRLVG